MIQKIKRIPDLLGRPLRATADDLASLKIPAEVRQALRIPVPAEMPTVPDAIPVQQILQLPALGSAVLFTGSDGNRYPCWLEGDENLGDDWLLTEEYYPRYHRLYQALGSRFSRPALLEFGVRTGYSGVAFVKAQENRNCSYTGVDPNLYVSGGLEKAAATFRQLRSEGFGLDYFLLEGFSSSSAVQNSLHFSGPYHLIHIDGEHTLFGKVFDLWIARNLLAGGGFVLVDDFEHHGLIADSVKIALQMGWYSKFSFYPTRRGLAVLSL
jgi:predicted O-methyltransferase YrrM